MLWIEARTGTVILGKAVPRAVGVLGSSLGCCIAEPAELSFGQKTVVAAGSAPVDSACCPG